MSILPSTTLNCLSLTSGEKGYTQIQFTLFHFSTRLLRVCNKNNLIYQIYLSVLPKGLCLRVLIGLKGKHESHSFVSKAGHLFSLFFTFKGCPLLRY